MSRLAVSLLLPLLLTTACGDSKSDDAVGQVSDSTRHRPKVEPTAEPVSLPPPAAGDDNRQNVQIVGHSGETTPLALKRTDILPLSVILNIAQSTVSGEVLEIDLDEDDRIMRYKVEMLTSTGRKIEIKINASTGTILEIEND
jgi:uncharacterized membrane protein YkoI